MQWELKKLRFLFILHGAQSFSFNSKATLSLTSLQAWCDTPELTRESTRDPCGGY